MRENLVAVAVIVCCLLNPRCAPAGVSTLPPLLFSVFCHKHPADCTSNPGTPNHSSAVRQLAMVNTTANSAIAPTEDTNRNWEIYPPEGNCADYAVSKRHTLLRYGWPSANLLLAEVEVRDSGEHHLVLIARAQDGTWVMDNLEGLFPAEEMKRHYLLIRVQSPLDPQRWETSLS